MKIKYLNILIISLFVSQLSLAQNTLRVGYITHDEPIAYAFNNEPQGIMPDLFSKVLNKMGSNYIKTVKWIPFDDEEEAEKQFINKELDFLLGEYSNADIDPHMLGVGVPIYDDPIFIIAKKKSLSIFDLFNLIWSDLLKTALIYSVGLIVLFTLIIYYVESTRHPHMRNSTRREGLWFTFFTVTACFLRDLVYEPVTNMARFFYGAWMIISLFLITVITSIVTSTIILSSTDSTIRTLELNHLTHQPIAYITAHHSHEILISNIEGVPKGYHSLDEIVNALDKEEILYAAIPESVFDALYHRSKVKIVKSKSPIGYESYKILISSALPKAFIDQFNDYLVDTMLAVNMYRLCSQYTDKPNHCNII